MAGWWEMVKTTKLPKEQKTVFAYIVGITGAILVYKFLYKPYAKTQKHKEYDEYAKFIVETELTK